MTLMSRDPTLFSRLSLGGSEDREDGLDDHDQNCHQILKQSFPLLSTDGQQNVSHQMCNSLSEFKHPGRFGACGSSSGRKKRCKPHELTSPLTLRDINQRIVNFVQDLTISNVELKFNFVSRALCKTIASLAQVYNLECLIEQKRLLPVASPRLRKTCLTRMASKEEIEPILRKHGREYSGLILNNYSKQQETGSKSMVHSPLCESHSKAPVPIQVVVGTGAQPLDNSNVGNRMLQGMGWRPGTGLGPECDGIRTPVPAYLRTKRVGLGFNL